MSVRYFYLKLIGFTLAITGFGYSITSLYNLYDYVFGYHIINNANILVMGIGVLLPMYMFVYGVFFYFYVDRDIRKINRWILVSSIDLIIFGIAVLIFKIPSINSHIFRVSQVVEFLHFSISYVAILLGIFTLHACIKYKL